MLIWIHDEFRNPGYSGSYSTAGTCTWTFPKTSSDICRIRLEFEELTTAAPTTQGECSTDYFQATGAATGNLSPRICGINTGEPSSQSDSETCLRQSLVTLCLTSITPTFIKCTLLRFPYLY